MNKTGLNAKRTILVTFVAAIALAIGLWAGASPQTPVATATHPSGLIVGLDMSTSLGDPGVYDIANLPTFEACVDVSTSQPQGGIFYVDAFVLNVTSLVAFSADLEYTSGWMQILESDVKQFLGTGNGVDNGSHLTPDADGAYSAAAVDTAGTHTGSGVLTRLKAQAAIPPSGGRVIDFGISTDEYRGVTLTADPGAFHPGDTTGDGIFDGPFTNLQGKIAVDRPDGDLDGVSNDCDNCPSTPNPGQLNTDVIVNPPGDSLGDACDLDDDDDTVLDTADNCVTVPNFDQTDTDSDGIGDACEDTDADGILDGLDNCPGIANPNQEDNELDGVGDVCDPDDDNDTVLDVNDNCPLNSNTDQADFDGDGIPGTQPPPPPDDDFGGDVCDDSDSDWFLDYVDNCPSLANTNQTDTDTDGVGNICDNCPDDPNPGQGDWNSDFVGDACDWSDNDEWNDAAEVAMGTDPGQGCAVTSTANDEGPLDAWPVDFNDDGVANLDDVIYAYITSLLPLGLDQDAAGPLVRMDMDTDGWIGLSDVILGFITNLLPDGLDKSCMP